LAEHFFKLQKRNWSGLLYHLTSCWASTTEGLGEIRYSTFGVSGSNWLIPPLFLQAIMTGHVAVIEKSSSQHVWNNFWFWRCCLRSMSQCRQN